MKISLNSPNIVVLRYRISMADGHFYRNIDYLNAAAGRY